jgi:hypothetical protein
MVHARRRRWLVGEEVHDSGAMAGRDWSTVAHADMAILATVFQSESTEMTSVTT